MKVIKQQKSLFVTECLPSECNIEIIVCVTQRLRHPADHNHSGTFTNFLDLICILIPNL